MELVADQSVGITVLWVFSIPCLRYAGLSCIKSICYNFFFRQFRAALFPGRIPVSPVDHPLDEKIPFTPSWVGIYLDFVAFWVRILGFLRSHYRRRGIKPALGFIKTIGRLYAFAAETYTKNLSTTKRPRYLARPRFLLIHAMDPHLMCIPSLHVMVVISAYTQFQSILRSLGDEERFAPQIEEIRRGALNITEAILYVKQHSVNCIAAAMYAMTCFDPVLFPQTEGADFASRLFRGAKNPGPADTELIRGHILNLYLKFLKAGNSAKTWEKPLVDFLRSMPYRRRKGDNSVYGKGPVLNPAVEIVSNFYINMEVPYDKDTRKCGGITDHRIRGQEQYPPGTRFHPGSD